MRKERIIRRISPHSAHSHSKARPKTWKLKKRMLQKKLNASCIPKSRRLRERAAEGGLAQMRAAPMPIRAKRPPQTMGNTVPGGERGGWTMVF